MNIMIVSRDRFFIAGAIALIVRAWRPECGSHPVFMAAEENQPLLLPDVVITDVPEEKERRSGRDAGQDQERLVKVFLVAHQRSRRPNQHILLAKKEAARQLFNLFSSKTSPLYLPSPLSRSLICRQPRGSALSKQQAMVLQYTRQGLSLTDISRVTQLSVKTISTHKRAIMRKLGIKNNGEFYQYAFGELSQLQ